MKGNWADCQKRSVRVPGSIFFATTAAVAIPLQCLDELGCRPSYRPYSRSRRLHTHMHMHSTCMSTRTDRVASLLDVTRTPPWSLSLISAVVGVHSVLFPQLHVHSLLFPHLVGNCLGDKRKRGSSISGLNVRP